MWTFSHQSPGYFSIRPVCLRVPNFKYFVLTNRKHKFLHALVVLRSECKKSPRKQDREPCAPCGNHEPCLTTPECPGFRHHSRERPEFLRSLLLLFLRFIDFSAAQKHCSNASAAFTGMRAGGWAGHSTRLGLVHALIIDWAPRLLPMQCPEFLTDCVIAFVPELCVYLIFQGTLKFKVVGITYLKVP